MALKGARLDLKAYIALHDVFLGRCLYVFDWATVCRNAYMPGP